MLVKLHLKALILSRVKMNNITRSTGGHSEAMGTVSAKEKTRRKIEADYQEFIASGGKVDVLPDNDPADIVGQAKFTEY